MGNNTSRKLDSDEFQGFALVDEIEQIAFFKFYEEYTDREWHSIQQSQASGGNFWNTQKWRIGALARQSSVQ